MSEIIRLRYMIFMKNETMVILVKFCSSDCGFRMVLISVPQ